MASKILLADDSQTIQKVIKITLEKGPYELTICENEEILLSTIKKINFDLILLDFSLSDNVNGYKLAEKIHNIDTSVRVLMMFGTFDSIDEEMLNEPYIVDRIVKPFDSTKFLEICRTILGGSSLEKLDREEDVIEDVYEDDWIINLDDLKDPGLNEEGKVDIVEKVEESESSFSEADSSELEQDENLLLEELSGWGMEVPPRKGHLSANFEIPPSVEIAMSKASRAEVEDEVKVLPREEDLNYPETNNLSDEKIELDLEGANDGKASFSSSLIPMEDLASENEEEALTSDDLRNDNADREEFKHILHAKKLEEQIQDEVTTESFWRDDGAKDTQDSAEIVKYLIEDFRDRMEDKLKPLLRKLVKDTCKEEIEKVAWEVIPSLAENIIQEEVEKILNAEEKSAS